MSYREDEFRVLCNAVSVGCVVFRDGDPSTATQSLDMIKQWLIDGVDMTIHKPMRH
jgi:hypothetical protein